MRRLNQNLRIQALMMLARGDNVSDVSRAFGCHRNTIIRVSDRRRPGRPWRGYKPSIGQVHYADALSTSFSNGDKFCKAVRYQQTESVAPPQASPATHLAKETQCGTSAYSTSSGCPLAVGTTAFPLGATAVGSGSIL